MDPHETEHDLLKSFVESTGDDFSRQLVQQFALDLDYDKLRDRFLKLLAEEASAQTGHGNAA